MQKTFEMKPICALNLDDIVRNAPRDLEGAADKLGSPVGLRSWIENKTASTGSGSKQSWVS
jgi:hypothetical protein